MENQNSNTDSFSFIKNNNSIKSWQVNLLIILISLLLIVLVAILYFLIFKKYNLNTIKSVNKTAISKSSPLVSPKASPVASIITSSNLIGVASRVYIIGCANTAVSPCNQPMLSDCASQGSYSTCPFTTSFETKLSSLAPPNQSGSLGYPSEVLTQNFQGGLLYPPTYSAVTSNTGGVVTATVKDWGSYVLTIVLINGQLLVNNITFNGKNLGLCTSGIGC